MGQGAGEAQGWAGNMGLAIVAWTTDRVDRAEEAGEAEGGLEASMDQVGICQKEAVLALVSVGGEAPLESEEAIPLVSARARLTLKTPLGSWVAETGGEEGAASSQALPQGCRWAALARWEGEEAEAQALSLQDQVLSLAAEGEGQGVMT